MTTAPGILKCLRIAAVNESRNGIVLTDTSGGSAGNMIVASADATETAEKLGIVQAGPPDMWVKGGTSGFWWESDVAKIADYRDDS